MKTQDAKRYVKKLMANDVSAQLYREYSHRGDTVATTAVQVWDFGGRDERVSGT